VRSGSATGATGGCVDGTTASVAGWKGAAGCGVAKDATAAGGCGTVAIVAIAGGATVAGGLAGGATDATGGCVDGTTASVAGWEAATGCGVPKEATAAGGCGTVAIEAIAGGATVAGGLAGGATDATGGCGTVAIEVGATVAGWLAGGATGEPWDGEVAPDSVGASPECCGGELVSLRELIAASADKGPAAGEASRLTAAAEVDVPAADATPGCCCVTGVGGAVRTGVSTRLDASVAEATGDCGSNAWVAAV